MAAVHDEYRRFLQWLSTADVTADAKRVAKIVQANVDTIVQSVAAGGQRARVVAPLLRQHIAQIDERIECVETQADASLPWTHLRKLTLGPFRGFRREEQFDLRKSVVLFYGPNGSGKTSLCEAIEYALLGDVEEASARRVESLDDYLDNIYEGYHVPPKLWSEGDNEGIPVVANKELLRFAIVEKNRIEGFARLAARSPAQATALIATLFGLDSFNEFVNNFTNTIDRHLELATPQKDALELKRTLLNEAMQRLADDAEISQSFAAEQERVANDFCGGYSYARLLTLLGTAEEPGRFQELTGLLEQPVTPQSGVVRKTTIATRHALRDKRLELTECIRELAERSNEVSYRDLYRSIEAIQADSPSSCPACETPIENVTTDPFKRAARGLELLRGLADLEQNHARLLSECDQLSRELKHKLALPDCLDPPASGSLAQLSAWTRSESNAPVWENEWIAKETWRDWLRVARRLEGEDAEIAKSIAKRSELSAERNRLAVARDRLLELSGRRDGHVAQVAAERERLQKFDETNAVLIEAVANEIVQNQLELRLQSAYSAYLNALRLYRDGLPERLLENLNDVTLDLYNQFNADDHPSDKLAKLALPLHAGDRVEIAFADSPTKMHDALCTLSEGHLRCLGLAILLAKNIDLALPILVFDDAVNAIDHDHRAGIRSTIFGDSRIKTKQMLITCHSNEFIKDIQNQLGEQASIMYVLDHHAGDHQPRVQNGTDRHYLTRAKERLQNGDQRQCLASCRQSLENLTSRLWRSLNKKSEELGKLSLVLRSSISRPELRELTLALTKNIEKGTKQGILQNDTWSRRLDGLNKILAIPERHLAWQYLNKGTHDEEDREDFELSVVRQIVDALTTVSATFTS